MKKLLALLFIFLITYSFTVSAQAPLTAIWGTKTLYKTPQVTYTPAPAGYKPVFINHVGRHGARHLTKEVNTSFAYQTLFKADSANELTTKGKKLLQMVIALDKVEKGNVKSISDEGKAELRGIGEGMYAHYSNVFLTNVNLNVTETKEIRTKQSADAFLSGLKPGLKKDPVIKESVDDVNLRFYDFSPQYKQFEEDGEWTKYYNAIEEEVSAKAINEDFAKGIFEAGFLNALGADAKEKFVGDVFGFAAITNSLKEEISSAGFKPEAMAFIGLFTPAQIKALSKLDLADDYYKKGPGIDNNGIQVRIAAPLLVNFIKTTDEFTQGGSINARLRFAHAETISPFAAILGISIADKSTKTTNISAAWQASKVIPLSSNIQWIFYKKGGSNKYLVKVLLNEQEVHITGMPNKGYPYYKWDELRKFYISKLKSLNVGLDTNMAAYLKKIM